MTDIWIQFRHGIEPFHKHVHVHTLVWQLANNYRSNMCNDIKQNAITVQATKQMMSVVFKNILVGDHKILRSRDMYDK